MPHESRLDFSFEQLLESPLYERPLIVNGIRCHGGFDRDGNYRSPRTVWRVPAIHAWQEQHRTTSPVPLVEIAPDMIPPYAPNVAQTRFLLQQGVAEPLAMILTEIAIVEGFGAMIREVPVPELKSFIREDTSGTALAHLTKGLFEAHARDEAGWQAEGGHRQMWEAARDAALGSPEVSPEFVAAIMARRGTGAPSRMFPDLDENVERLLTFMINVLVIEVFAASTFAWAEEILSDRELSQSPEEAGELVRFIRSDESPHVEYLRTALSEIAARTLIARDGTELAGKAVIDGLLARAMKAMVKQRSVERPAMLREMVRRTAKRADVGELLQEFESLGAAQ